MDMKMMIKFFAIVALCGLIKTSYSITVRYNCMPSQVAGSEFKFTVRIRKDGDNTITGITAVDASVTPTTSITPTASTCTTSSEESTGIYALTADIDTQSLSCGVKLGSGTVYKVQVRALGTNKYYTFNCDTANLLPSSVSVTGFSTNGVTGVLHHIENPFGVKAQVIDADGNGVPVRSVKLGQNIKLRVIYDTGHIETGPTNMGMVFHTGYIKHTGSNLFLRFFTPGLGTNVHITGVLSGNMIDQWVTVRRESPVEMTIPTEYQNTAATKDSWTKETRGLKIESRDSRIGVILVAEKNNDASEMTIFPDDILGTDYRPFASTQSSVNGDQEVLLIGTKASTQVTITYNSFTKPASFKVDGTNVGNGAPTTVVTLTENEVLHMLCDNSCDKLKISSTEKIAVISGWDNQGHQARPSTKGHSSTQVIPTNYYSNKYVTTAIAGRDSGYFIHTADPTDTTLTITDSTRNGQTIGSPFYENIIMQEVEFSKPVSMHKHISDGTGITPALYQFPSIAQWGTSYFLTLKDGADYTIIIVTTKGNFGEITLNGRTMTSYGYTASDIPKLSTASASAPANYEVSVFVLKRSQVGKPVAHFKSSDPSKTFLLEVHRRISGDNSLTAFLPFGVRYPVTKSCSNTAAKPGDLIDNDCDGKVDEERLNNVDDDGDTKVDEDLTLNSITASFRGIYVKTLVIADNNAFTGATNVHSSGCNVINPTTKIMSTIQPFKKNKDLASDFTDYWVIDTEKFNAFKYFNKDKVYFRIVFDFCVADLTLCENSCKAAAGKRKRSIDDKDKFVDFVVQVTGNDTDVQVIGSNINDVINTKEHENEVIAHPCTNNAVLWVPLGLLLVTILFETAMTVHFLHKRFTLMNRM